MFAFEQFPVYVLAKGLYKSFSHHALTNYKISPAIRSQLQRASSSIMLNIAEGAGKYSKREKKNYYLIARDSTHECVGIIDVLMLENHLSRQLAAEQKNTLEEISKMLSGLINKMLT